LSWGDPVLARRCPASRRYPFFRCHGYAAAIPAKGVSALGRLGSVEPDSRAGILYAGNARRDCYVFPQ
jgi:hypothetical protein